MLRRNTGFSSPPYYYWYDFTRILWAGRRWRHSERVIDLVFPDCKCKSCREHYKNRKATAVNSGVGGNGGSSSVGGGGAGGSAGGYWRCKSCFRAIAGGTCSACGPLADIEYVTLGGGGAGGSSVGSGGAGRMLGQAYNYVVGGGGGGSGSYVAPNMPGCANCGTPIPSGIVCSVRCLRNYNPNLVIYASGCMDCGSGLHPSYNAGCLKAGWATQYLPIPGPLGSMGLNAAGQPVWDPSGNSVPPAPVKPKIRSNGLDGYSEEGTPDDWDLAMGAIRGYRWFKIDIPVSWAGIRNRTVQPGYYDATGKPSVTDEGMLDLPDSELPSLTGAYSGTWEDGVNEAKCRRTMTTSPSDFKHEPPEVRTACGCGFWAYFDEHLGVDTVLSNWYSPTKDKSLWTGIAVLGCIEGTGRVIVGEKGFRSQYAKVVGLAVGQASVPILMWWQNQSYTGPGYSTPRYRVQEGKVQCSDAEVLARLVKIEDMLARKYPSARIMSSENTLRSLYPTDKNAGGS